MAEITRAELIELFLDQAAEYADSEAYATYGRTAEAPSFMDTMVTDPRDGEEIPVRQLLELIRLGKDSKGVLRG